MNHGAIIQIDDCLVSEEILTEYFSCDYGKCKGCCCVIGDSGAPLEECETEAIEKNYPVFSGIMQESGRKAVSERDSLRWTLTGTSSPLLSRAARNVPTPVSTRTGTASVPWRNAGSRGRGISGSRFPVGSIPSAFPLSATA